MKSDHFFKEDDSDEEENEKRPTKVLKVTTHPLNKATIHPEKMDVVLRAMKKEWWYDIFDVDQAEYDVMKDRKRTTVEEDFDVLFSTNDCFRLNYRESSNFSELLFKSVNRSAIKFLFSVEVFYR